MLATSNAPAPPMTDALPSAERAQELLQVLAGPNAVLRPAQAAAIDAVVTGRRRALVVQRTGFGKSAVYFIATRMLRRSEEPRLNSSHGYISYAVFCLKK